MKKIHLFFIFCWVQSLFAAPSILGDMNPLACEITTYTLDSLNCTFGVNMSGCWFNFTVQAKSGTNTWTNVGTTMQVSQPSVSIAWATFFASSGAATQNFRIITTITDCDTDSCNKNTSIISGQIEVKRCALAPCPLSSASHTISNSNTITVPCNNTQNIELCAFNTGSNSGTQSFSWTLPSGWSFVSGSGTNTRCVTISPSATGGHNASICVRALAGGTYEDGSANLSQPCCIIVNRGSVPAPSFTPNSPYTLCYNNVTTPELAVLNPIQGQTYTWTLYSPNNQLAFITGPTGFLITASTTTGTTAYVKNISSTTKGIGWVKLKTATACAVSGDSPPLAININAPVTPTLVFSGLCSNPSSTVANNSNAATYSWSVSGGTITSASGNGVEYNVTVGANQWVNVGCWASNICGTTYTYLGKKKPTCGGGINRIAQEEDALGFETQEGISVFPNPFEDKLRIVLQEENTYLYSVELMDISGKRVLITTPEKETQFEELVTEGLPAGLYFYKVYTNQGIFIGKVLK